jgi:hypothetical protein
MGFNSPPRMWSVVSALLLRPKDGQYGMIFLVEDLGRIGIHSVQTVGRIQILAKHKVRRGHVEVDGLDIIAADARAEEDRPYAYGVYVLQGAFTLWNMQVDKEVILTADLINLSVGRFGSPASGSGVVVSGSGDEGGRLSVQRLETKAVFVDGGIAPGTADMIAGGVFVVYALYESGLDNSPMYDGVPFNPKTNLIEISDVGLNALYVADCQALEEIARILGREEDRAELRGREGKYAAALAMLWDEKAGIYLNRRTDIGEASSKLSPTNFYPLIAKAPTPEQARRMIQEHYFNAQEFHGEWVMPSIARNVPGYGDQNYWRGRIWGPHEFPGLPWSAELRLARRAGGPGGALGPLANEELAERSGDLRELQREHRRRKRRAKQ